jgi:hypothetical protein
MKNSIELLCLPAHTSGILQPLDVGVFKGVKSAWRKCLRQYYDETRYSNVDKRAFPNLLKRVVDGGAFSRSNAIGGFEGCGIFPLNPEKIGIEKLSTATPLMNESLPTNGTMQTVSPESIPSAIESRHSTCPITSPRKHIEAALLSHFRQVTPTGPPGKGSRVKRTLAECLTSQEVLDRLKQAEKSASIKKKKTKTTAPVTTNVTENPTSESSRPKDSRQASKKQRFQKHKAKKFESKTGNTGLHINIRKPAWLVGSASTTASAKQTCVSDKLTAATANDDSAAINCLSTASISADGMFCIVSYRFDYVAHCLLDVKINLNLK